MSIAKTVTRLLKLYGEQVTFTQDNDEVEGPTGDVTPLDPVTHQTRAYPSEYKQNEVDGKNIMAGDSRLICETMPARPVVGWRVTVDGKDYRVITVRPVRKLGADIAHVCHVRKE